MNKNVLKYKGNKVWLIGRTKNINCVKFIYCTWNVWYMLGIMKQSTKDVLGIIAITIRITTLF